MKVLVTGAGGLLGREVWESFGVNHQMMALGRHQPAWVSTKEWIETDLSDAPKTYSAVTRINPDLVVHCAAYNNVDESETNPALAYQGNALAVRNLALACQRFDTAMMYVSTDYVFDGESAPDEGYREFDVSNPISRYGESKRWGELFVQQLLNKFFIVRTSWLFGPGRQTWVDRIVELAREGSPINAVKDMISAPTYTPDLANAMKALAESQHFGVYHLTNTGFCNRVELAKEVLRLHKLGSYSGLKEYLQKDLKLPARRPAFSGLANLAWTLDGFKPLRPWKQALMDHFSRAQVPL